MVSLLRCCLGANEGKKERNERDREIEEELERIRIRDYETNDGSIGPTCVLKVNIQCCKACPRAVMKQLTQIKGANLANLNSFYCSRNKGLADVWFYAGEYPSSVKHDFRVTGIHIDTEQGLVTVSGVEDASILIKAIKKIGRKAELCKFEMQSKPQDDANSTCSEITHDTDSDKDVHASHFNGYGSVGSSTVPSSWYEHSQISMQSGPSGYLSGSVPSYPHTRPEGPPPMACGGPPPYPYNYYQPYPPAPWSSTYPGEPWLGGYGPVSNSSDHTSKFQRFERQQLHHNMSC